MMDTAPPQPSPYSHRFEEPCLSPQDVYVPWPVMEEGDEQGASLSPSSSKLPPDLLRERPLRKSSWVTTARHSERRPSTASSLISTPSCYAPPSRPLPPIPSSKRSSKRISTAGSFDRSSINSKHLSLSQSSDGVSARDSASFRSSTHTSPMNDATNSYYQDQNADGEQDLGPAPSRIHISFTQKFASDKKKPKHDCVYHLDISPASSILASKHGNNIIKVWSAADGTTQSVIKFSSYTEPQTRSREYLIRSHVCLSETANLIAIATRFGRSIDIYNWATKKVVQSIANADRWAAGRFGLRDSTGGGALAVYQQEGNCINVYTDGPGKVPFQKTQTIDLSKAELPFLPQYPEVALSPTSPMLVAAVGPRPPRPGHPPPDHETLLAAWTVGGSDGNGSSSSSPYVFVRLWEHKELEMAIPYELMTYGSVVVSIWIPASFKVVAVDDKQTGMRWKIYPVTVNHRYALVWDLTSNATRTIRIPNCISCVSPDCRYVAYCHASSNNMGGKGKIAIIDVMSGREVWCWPDPEATAMESGPQMGLEQLESLNRVTELKFSGNGEDLIIGDMDGRVCMYRLHE